MSSAVRPSSNPRTLVQIPCQIAVRSSSSVPQRSCPHARNGTTEARGRVMRYITPYRGTCLAFYYFVARQLPLAAIPASRRERLSAEDEGPLVRLHSPPILVFTRCHLRPHGHPTSHRARGPRPVQTACPNEHAQPNETANAPALTGGGRLGWTPLRESPSPFPGQRPHARRRSLGPDRHDARRNCNRAQILDAHRGQAVTTEID